MFHKPPKNLVSSRELNWRSHLKQVRYTPLNSLVPNFFFPKLNFVLCSANTLNRCKRHQTFLYHKHQTGANRPAIPGCDRTGTQLSQASPPKMMPTNEQKAVLRICCPNSFNLWCLTSCLFIIKKRWECNDFFVSLRDKPPSAETGWSSASSLSSLSFLSPSWRGTFHLSSFSLSLSPSALLLFSPPFHTH